MLKLVFIVIVLIEAVNLTDVSYYEILGITKQASTQEIKQAYKKLVVKFHPDKNPNEAKQEKFLKITEAYETLKDPEKRRNYDLYGSYTTYSRKYDYKSQSEYDNLYYKGLYHNDPFVDTLSGSSFYNYLNEGFHFINFYSPFCPPCQNIADHWKKLAEIYKGIVKVGAVNCKYHNSFCYNSMRIGSYPTLLFYPNGKSGNYLYYRGDRTFEALDDFVMTYLNSHVHVPTVSQLRNTDRPIAYVLGANRIDRSALTRIAYRLNGLVAIAIIEDESLRDKLSESDYTTIVFKYKGFIKDIESTNEEDVLKDIVAALPKIELIDPEKLKNIRNKLRRGEQTPWVLYFSTKGSDRLVLHQMRMSFPNLNFGEIDCDKWAELCSSLHVEAAPAWAVLKRGGAYQRAYAPADARTFVRTAAAALSLHTLSASDLNKILEGDVGVWVLLVVPHGSPWDSMAGPFTQTSMHFNNDENVSFGIMICKASTDQHCRGVAPEKPVVLLQNFTRRHTYRGELNERELLEYINMLRDSEDLELTEKQVLEISDPSREHAWLVAYLPAHCGAFCDDLAHHWMIVASKLRPLTFVRVGMLQCAKIKSGFCTNIRSATARLYPIASGQHYSVSLQHLSEAPYILEWALQFIDDSVVKLNWKLFARTVIAEELNPTSGIKPWLVYFHSPRCYRCYEMYADFAIAGILLNNAVQLGKVNCLNERGLCQHEHITSYPSLKLYLGRNSRQRFSSVVTLQVRDHKSILEEIEPHLRRYDASLLATRDGAASNSIRHDEF